MKKIKLVAMDVDGTLTNGKIYMGIHGEVMKAFDIKDGLAIHELLPMYGVVTAIITGRTSDIVNNRAKELEISYVFQGISNKAEKLKELTVQLGVSLEETFFIGDDLGDIPAMELAGFSACPGNAVDKVCAVADYVAKKYSGDGAVREIVEWLIKNEMLGA